MFSNRISEVFADVISIFLWTVSVNGILRLENHCLNVLKLSKIFQRAL